MPKTNFVNGDPSQGIMGTVVTAEFLNAINKHRHTGEDVDGAGLLDYAIDTGTANNYVINLVNFTAHVPGMPIYFKAANTNTGASTITINNLAPVALKKEVNQSLSPDDIKAGQIVEIIWDGVNYQMRSMANNIVPVGSLMPYAGNIAPSGWLLCYGQAISRSTYANLFAVIGTTYGAGDGSTTFNLPDLRGRTLIGLDNMGGTSANRVTAAEADILGGTSGSETHTLTINEIPSHNHAAEETNDFAPNPYRFKITQGNSTGNTANINPTGGGLPHNNMQPYMALNYIIKY